MAERPQLHGERDTANANQLNPVNKMNLN